MIPDIPDIKKKNGYLGLEMRGGCID